MSNEDQKESSVLFSLNELFSIEQDRIKQEENAKIKAAEDAKRAEEDARRKQIEEEKARFQAEQERERQEELRRKQETMQLEAEKLARIERERIAAEESARLDAMRAQQQHALEIAKLKQDKSKKTLTYAIIGVSAFVVIGLVGGGLWWRNYSAQERAERDRIAAERDQDRKEIEEAQRRLDETRSQMAKLADDAAKATDAASKLMIEARIKDAQIAMEKDTLIVSGGGKKGPAPKTNTGTKAACQPGDPMCGL